MSMAKYGDQSRGFTYDVFLSFRGEDTRHNFIGYLRDALQKRGINAFFDDKNLRIGEDISPALLKAIEESKISVIVFSENYASSRWCLAELVKIIECTKRNKKQIAFPIFYRVDPSDVRNQRNSYGEAMVAHENRFGKDSKNIKAWKAALSQAADLKGHHIHTGFEIDHIKEIVEKVHAKIAPKPLLVGENPVGLDQRIEEVKSLLDMKPNDDTICMLGICGLGGIGKTELAKALYNKIVHQFEAASFLANVREKSNKINGPEDLQKTLLSEMFEQPDTELGSTSKGIYEIKYKLGKKKVLLVLDDVDEMEQIGNLAGGSDWFGPGSRVIITTRDKGLLVGTHSFVVQSIYEMTELSDQHSLELFCRNAFGKSNPETGYEAMSSRAVGYAKGLPLALKVIGSNLATRKSLKAWEHALKDYERIPRKGIQDVLKVSYDVLEPYAQSVFLDIACFFKGERIEYVEEILDEFSAASNIEELVNKSLLIIDHGYLNMHDLIQEMGREIVRQEAPSPAKRSRLWFHQDVIDVLSADNSGSDAIQGIMLDPPQRIKEVDWSDTAFEKMNRLRILIVRNTTFSSEPKHLPNHLRLLDWEVYPSKSFPPKFYPRNIIILNMPYSQLTMEEPFKQFSYLTVMNFSNNQSITTMPDLCKVENLRELLLENCKNLTTVHESIGFLKHLVILSASGCTKLENFVQRMFLPSLEVLDLNLCVKLEHFPDIVNKMNKPLKIYMTNTSIKKLPNSIDNLIGLVSIEMPYSKNLEYLPSSLFTLPNVVAFKFGGCSKLGESFRRFLPNGQEANESSTVKAMHFGNSGLSDEDIQAILTCFPKLEELIASDNNLVSLPVCIKESDHLTKLDVSGCSMLKKIPECTNLRILNVHGCVKLEHISELPCTIRKIDARYCIHLNRETSDMLWYQVKKERHGLEIVMPITRAPEWLDYSCIGGNPCFWVRGKFPNVALAFVFQDVIKKERKSRRLLVELHLVINGQCVPRKGYYNFRIEPNHVLVCDLQLLFNDEEWLGLDALFLKQEWNQVQVSYEASSSVTVGAWGVYVYKQGTTNLEEHVQFTCPDPTRYSNIANTIVPTKDPLKEQIMMIEELALDEMLNGSLAESMNMQDEIVDKFQDQLTMLRELSKEVNDALKGKPLDENSKLAWMLQTIKESYDDDENEPPTPNLNHKDELMKPPPMDAYVGETSTSGHKRSLEARAQEINDENILEWNESRTLCGAKSKLFCKLLEEQNALRKKFEEIENESATMDNSKKGHSLNEKLAAVLKGRAEELQRLYDAGIEGFQNSNEIQDLMTATYSNGMRNGVLEAQAILLALDMDIMTQVFERNENEISAQDKDSRLLPSSENQYYNFVEKLNTQFAWYSSNKDQSPDGTDDCHTKESSISDSKSSLGSTKVCANIGKESCKDVIKHKKLAAVLKERGEELTSLYDAEIEQFQNSEEIQDLMSATYLSGLRDGVLEAQATLLSLNMDRPTPMFEETKEHITHEAANDDAVNENHDDKTIGIDDNPSPTGPEVDKSRDTPYTCGCFWRILHTCFCKCFS